jgi:DNA-binding NarL/FixJ family response regulator
MSPEPRPIRVLVADDHQLIRQAIGGLVGDQPDMRLVGEAASGREAVEQFRLHRPDVALMDLQMPELNGIEALTAIRAEFPEARIIVLTTYTGDVQVLRAIKAGASGYLLKSTLVNELLAAVRAVHAGRKALSTEVSFDLAEHSAQDALSPLEVRVLRLIAEGHTNKAIGVRLSITEEAVKGQVRSILSKLGTDDRTHAVVIGLKRGIIDL